MANIFVEESAARQVRYTTILDEDSSPSGNFASAREAIDDFAGVIPYGEKRSVLVAEIKWAHEYLSIDRVSSIAIEGVNEYLFDNHIDAKLPIVELSTDDRNELGRLILSFMTKRAKWNAFGAGPAIKHVVASSQGPGECGGCSGTGEGKFDGVACSSCRGSGVEQ